MDEKEGPSWTDYNGDLPKPILICSGCKWLRFHDGHYFYCAGQGGESQYWTKEPVIRLKTFEPNEMCPFPPKA